MNNDIFEQSVIKLFSIQGSRKLICEFCRQPIVVCNRCNKTRTGKLQCAGKGFIHTISTSNLHKYLAHTCDYTIEWALDDNDDTHQVAFPILTQSEIDRINILMKVMENVESNR